jgi:hypothetical protein
MSNSIYIKLLLLILSLALIAGCSYIATQYDEVMTLERRLGIDPAKIYRWNNTDSTDWNHGIPNGTRG